MSHRTGVLGTLVAALVIGVLTACGTPTADLLAAPVAPKVSTGLPQDPEQVRDLRTRLRQTLFGTPDLSGARSGPPTRVETGISLPEPIARRTSAQITSALPLRFDLTSTVTVLNPLRDAGCALVWHAGHGDDPFASGGGAVIVSALDSGCRVAVLEMPLRGSNRGKIASLPDGRKIDASRPAPYVWHNQMQLLESGGRNVLDLFIAPVIQTVDLLLQDRPASRLVVAGVSGGGWTVTVAAAADDRISRAMSVAGSTTEPNIADCEGDYEQCNPQLLATTSFQQLYVLAAAAPARTFAQVLNFYDTCCYQGVDGSTYVPAVRASIASSGGGQFLFTADRSVKDHTVPPSAVAVLSTWFRTTA